MRPPQPLPDDLAGHPFTVRAAEAAGLVEARRRGKKGGRPQAMKPADVAAARALLDAGRDDLARILDAVDSPANGLTLCSGSLGAGPQNNVEALVREFGGRGRIHFAHIRNVKVSPDGDFEETAHLSSCGSLDVAAIVKAYHDVGFDGYVRPDHGRMIWGETGKPGYGLYDRALGAVYINGLWEAVGKFAEPATSH